MHQYMYLGTIYYVASIYLLSILWITVHINYV